MKKKFKLSPNFFVSIAILIFCNACNNMYKKKEYACTINMKDSKTKYKKGMFDIDNKKKSREKELSKKRKEQLSNIPVGSEFERLVLKRNFFLDKSLFIKEIIDNDSPVLYITMPRRWGKSVNLSMLHKFLANDDKQHDDKQHDDKQHDDKQHDDKQHDDKQHDYFKDLKISQEEAIVKSYFKKFPVIYITFKDTYGENYEEIKDNLRKKIRKVFHDHDFLSKSNQLNENEKEYFNSFQEFNFSKELKESELKESLWFLSHCLYKHYNKKCWILIDEYDALLNKVYKNFEDENVNNVKELYIGVLSNALKGNKYLEKGVLTGILSLALSLGESGLNNGVSYNITSDKYSPYYGINKDELNKLKSDSIIINDNEIEDIQNWYNGYSYINFENKRIEYSNIWSVFNYLKFGELKSYWTNSDDFNYIKPLFNHKELMDKFEKLLFDSKEKSIKFDFIDKFDFEEFKKLKSIIDNIQLVELNKRGRDIIFSYLFLTGYLAKDNDDKSEDYYCLPNKEIKYEFVKCLQEAFETVYSFDTQKLNNISDYFRKILLNSNSINNELDENLLKKIQNEFANILDTIKLINRDDSQEEGLRLNEDAIHTILNITVFLIKNANKGSEIYSEIYNQKNKGILDIMLKDSADNIGIIIEMKFDKSANDALQQAKKYTLIDECCKKIYIGINVSSEEGSSTEMKWEIK